MRSSSCVPFNRQTQSGFTLIELMITVAIVAILAAIAIPSYSSYVQRGYRASARSAMLEAAQFMERYKSVNFKYRDSSGNPPTLPASVSAAPSSGTKRYDVTVAASSDSAFTLTATPSGWTDSLCGNLTLTNLGVRGQSLAGATAARCWDK